MENPKDFKCKFDGTRCYIGIVTDTIINFACCNCKGDFDSLFVFVG